LSSVDYHYTLEQAIGGTIRQAMHPGTTIRRDCIEKNGLSVTDAARISNLLNARSGISPEMAVRLEKAFGTPAREWLIRQLDYELTEVMRRANKIKVEPFRANVQRAAERRGTI
jgi:addiction module HigA family antidote